jgi:tetratricopeptide (TPR) repeat protein/predicted aspartyl protease
MASGRERDMKLWVLLSAVAAAGLALAGEVAARDCQLKKKAELPLGYASGMMTVEAKINGAPVILGIDTGAQTLVSPETAVNLKLARDWRRTLARGTTATTIASHVMLRDLEFAGDHFTWKSVAKIELPHAKMPGTAAITKPLAGLLGMDILGDYDLDFDFPHRKLTLYDASTCSAISPPGYSSPKSVPFKFNGQRNILLPIEWDGVKLTALLDTGSTLHMVTHAGLKKTGVTDDMLKTDPSFEASGVGNVAQKHSLHKFKTLAVGGLTFTNVAAGVLNRPLWQGEALLGQPIMLGRRFWVSSATRTLYLENPPFNFATGTQGPALFSGGIAKVPSELTWGQACLKYPALGCGAKTNYITGSATAAGSKTTETAPLALAPAPANSQQASADPKPSEPPQFPGLRVAFGFLGVETRSISEECGKALGLSGPAVVVQGFSNSSPGLDAGLRRADIITALNGEAVRDAISFTDSVQKLQPGQIAKLTVSRPAGQLELQAEIKPYGTQPADVFDQDGKAVLRIETEDAILAKLPEQGCTQERAISHVALGSAYNRRKAAEGMAGFREQAIQNLEQGLMALDKIKFAREWGIGQIHLGYAYRLRSIGNRGDNIEKSTHAYEAALTVDKNVMAHIDRGRALTGLGIALLNRGTGQRSENIELAIQNFREAAQTIDAKVYPKDWGDLHRALAGAYLDRFEGPREGNVEEAAKALEEALPAFSAFPNEKSAVLTQLERLKAERPAAPAHN